MNMSDDAGSATPPREEEGGEEEEDEEEREGGEGSEEEEDRLSLLSEESGKDWKPDMSGKLAWLHRCTCTSCTCT